MKPILPKLIAGLCLLGFIGVSSLVVHQLRKARIASAVVAEPRALPRIELDLKAPAAGPVDAEHRRGNALASGVRRSQALEAPLVSSAEVEAYLARSGDSLDALLAAATLQRHTPAYLRRAADVFPDEPRVHLALLSSGHFSDERGHWIGRFLESDPENALASYLSAQWSLENGDTVSALGELRSSATKAEFEDYARHTWQGLEEFYRYLGYSPADSKLFAFSGMEDQLRQHMDAIRDLGSGLFDVYGEYNESGFQAAAEELALLAIDLGNRLSQGEASFLFLHELTGMGIESLFLEEFDRFRDYPFFPQTIPEMLDSLAAQESEIDEMTGYVASVADGLPDESLEAYLDRMKVLGEREAVRWLQSRNTGKS